MEDALLAVAVFTALMAAGAFLVPLWQQRTKLDLVFAGGYSSSPGGVTLSARVDNDGRSAIHNVELYSGPPGMTLLPESRIETVTLSPFTDHGFSVAADADSDSGGITLRTPVLIVARYGRRMTITEMPVGRYSSDRARTATHRARGTVPTWGGRLARDLVAKQQKQP